MSKNSNRLFHDHKNELPCDATYVEAHRSIGDQRNHVFRDNSRRGSTNTATARSIARTDTSNSCTNKSRESDHQLTTTKKKKKYPIQQQELSQRMWESPETDTLFTSSDEGGTTTSKEESVRFNLLLEDMQPNITASRLKGNPKKDLPPIIIGFHRHNDKGFVVENEYAINELLDDIELQLNDMNTIVGSSTVGDSSEGTKSLTYMENNDANSSGYDEVLRWLEAKKQKGLNSSVKSTLDYQDTRQEIATTVNGENHLCKSNLESEESHTPTGTDKVTGSNSITWRMETKHEPLKSSCCCQSLLPSTCIIKLIFAFCVIVAVASIYFLVAVILARYTSIQILPFSITDA